MSKIITPSHMIYASILKNSSNMKWALRSWMPEFGTTQYLKDVKMRKWIWYVDEKKLRELVVSYEKVLIGAVD